MATIKKAIKKACPALSKNKAPLSPLNKFNKTERSWSYITAYVLACADSHCKLKLSKQLFLPEHTNRSSHYHAIYQCRSIYHAFSTLPFHLPSSLYLYFYTIAIYRKQGKIRWAKLPWFSWFLRVLQKFSHEYLNNKHRWPRHRENIPVKNFTGLKPQMFSSVNISPFMVWLQ